VERGHCWPPSRSSMRMTGWLGRSRDTGRHGTRHCSSPKEPPDLASPCQRVSTGLWS